MVSHGSQYSSLFLKRAIFSICTGVLLEHRQVSSILNTALVMQVSDEWALWQSAFNDNKLILVGDKATVDKEIWRFFTYSFVHSGWQHLLGRGL